MKYYLGIDLGTSSVKVIKSSVCGECSAVAVKYGDFTLSGMREALVSAIRQTDLSSVAAIGFSSQVGTYIVDGRDILPWNSTGGSKELDCVLSEVDESVFIEEISMPHPSLISYPLPAFLRIKEMYPSAKRVCMPKEYFIEELTGNFVTDRFSQRGVANLKTGEYSKRLLEKFGIKYELARIIEPTEMAGRVTAAAAEAYGLPRGLTVYAGLNDFFAGLLGMGVVRVGDCFDLTGTSEHIGYISDGLDGKAFVSGPFLSGNASYGGTKCSGTACDIALREFDCEGLDLSVAGSSPPVFLPYLNGERAPIFDDGARGVFFGVTSETTKKQLAYAVLEGVVFSLYDIAVSMGLPEKGGLTVGGGGASSELLCRLKSELFAKRVVRTEQSAASALGAAMIAMIGEGEYGDYESAAAAVVRYLPPIESDGRYRALLSKRFALFKKLYSDLKEDFEIFNGIKGE